MQHCCTYVQNLPTNTTTEASLSAAVDNLTARLSDLSINAPHDSVFSILETTTEIRQHLGKIEPSQIKEVEKAYHESQRHGDSHIARIFLHTFFYPKVIDNQGSEYIEEVSMTGIIEFTSQQPQADDVLGPENAAVMLCRLLRAADEIYANLTKRNGETAVLSVSTFNIKSDKLGRGQRGTYRVFLEHIFDKLDCDINLIQECMWKKSTIWEDILPGHTVQVTNAIASSEYHAGIAVANLKAGKFNRGGTHRWGYQLLTVTEQQKVKFLSFSYHGSRKVSDKKKKNYITQFISTVMKFCDEQKRPAIVGGDFNYDIRRITWTDKIKPHIQICAGSPEPHTSIDFLCVVHGETFQTKIVMPKTLLTRLDVAKDGLDIAKEGLEEDQAAELEKIKGKITTHPALFGHILLYHQ